MTGKTFDPTQTLGSYRKSDAVIIVCQHNERKVVEIAALNYEAARVTGYTNEELVGQPIERLLPKRINDTVAEFIEYGDNENDFMTVLGKVKDFAVKPRASGREVPFRLRIIRGEEIDKNPYFHLVLIDEDKLRQSNAFREMLKENFKGHEVIDVRTGLADRASLIKDMELCQHSVRSNQISAVFAAFDINYYERMLHVYGAANCNRLHRHVGQICKNNLRAEDAVGSLSERMLGVILIDAPKDPAHLVLNRLRWAISTSPITVEQKGLKEDLIAQVNVGFAQMDGKVSEAEILKKFETFLADLRTKNIHNSIQPVVVHERRVGERVERRVQNIPVAVERRKGPRRKLGPKPKPVSLESIRRLWEKDE